MPKTYEPIATYTIPSAVNNYTFSSIPSTYTDIILIASVKNNSGGSRAMQMLLNGDTGTNYSSTTLQGDGSSVVTTRNTGTAYLDPAITVSGTDFTTCIFNFQSYANSSVYKSILLRVGSPGTNLRENICLWRSTAAINSIKIQLGGTDGYVAGTTFTLYGIKAA